jgi:hypothetical protein
MSPPVCRPTRPTLRAAALALGVGLSVQAVRAVAGEAPWTLSGFGTLDAVHSNRHDADFTTSALRAAGAGYSHRWSLDVDSRLGVQLDLALARRWSAVVQVVSEQRGDNSYRPMLEWANVKYQATPDLALRAGRIALPMFLAADYRKVGYIYPWVRPPVELYGSMPISSSNGVDLTWRWASGSVRHATQAFYGRADASLVPTGTLRARGIAGFSSHAELGPASARVSLLTANVTLDGWRRPGGAPGAVPANSYAVDLKRTSLLSVGLNYDPGQWFAMAEAGYRRSDASVGNLAALYASAGYRWRNLTPWVGYSTLRAQAPRLTPALVGLAQLAAAAGAGPAAAALSAPAQSTVSLGARWDFRTDLAFKLQYDRVTPGAGSAGTLINIQRDFVPGASVQVASVALDFVF